MPSEFDLLRPLDTEPGGASTVDVQRAITDARRRKARRGASFTGAAALTVVAVAGVAVAGGVFHRSPATPAATGKPKPSAAATEPKPAYTIPGTPGWKAPAATAPTSCTVEQLANPGGVAQALVSSADPTGRYIVGRSYPKSGYQAVIWHDGVGKDVELPGDSEESLQDVNSTGTAVGWSYTDGEGGVPLPYAYRNGKVSKLGGVKRGQAYAINNAGAIVGDDEVHPLVWPSVSAKAIRLPVPAGAEAATARDIDEDGTTVGTIDNAVPYVWFADGTHHALKLPGFSSAEEGRVFTIRNGWATGVVNEVGAANGSAAGKASPGDGRPVRWNVRTGEVTAVDQLSGYADAVNAQGWQVGIGTKGRPVLVVDGATVNLPGIADHPANTLSDIPASLSDDGRVVTGQSDDKDDVIKAVVWHCE